jgi:hypothetical protein
MSAKISKLKSGFYNTFIKSNALLPNEFFDIRDERVLKTKNMPLVYGLTGLIYAITAAIFIALFVTQSQSYSLETTITTSDKTNDPQESGHSSYTCNMASFVTKTVALKDEGTSTTFTSEVHLSAVNELYPQCVADMKAADPCSSPANFLFNAAGLDQSSLGDIVLSPPDVGGSVSVSGNSQFFYGVYRHQKAKKIEDRPFKYDLLSGDIVFGEEINADHTSKYVVADKLGNPYFLDFNGRIASFNSEFTNFDTSFLGSNDGLEILNDNNYDIYYIKLVSDQRPKSVDQQYQRLADKYRILIHFQSSDPTRVLPTTFAFAIRNQNSKNKDDINFYFYYDYSDPQGRSRRGLTIYNHVTKEYKDLQNPPECKVGQTGDPYDIGKPQVDLAENFLYCVNYAYEIVQFDLRKNKIAYWVAPEKNSYQIYSFSVVNNDFLLISIQNNVLNTYALGFYNHTALSLSNNISLIQTARQLMNQYLYTGFTGSRAGFFTCTSKLMPEFIKSPSLLYKACRENGIMWDLSITKSTKLLSVAQAKTLFINEALSYCQKNDVVKAVCGEVQSLPPYICTRKVYSSIFTVLSTAIANSATVLGFLLLIFGAFIGKFSDFADSYGCKSGADIDPNHQNCSSRKYANITEENYVQDVEVGTLDVYVSKSDFPLDDDRLPTESNPDPRAHAYFEVDGGVEVGLPPDNDVVK